MTNMYIFNFPRYADVTYSIQLQVFQVVPFHSVLFDLLTKLLLRTLKKCLFIIHLEKIHNKISNTNRVLPLELKEQHLILSKFKVNTFKSCNNTVKIWNFCPNKETAIWKISKHSIHLKLCKNFSVLFFSVLYIYKPHYEAMSCHLSISSFQLSIHLPRWCLRFVGVVVQTSFAYIENILFFAVSRNICLL